MFHRFLASALRGDVSKVDGPFIDSLNISFDLVQLLVIAKHFAWN